jgi:hypothetical protein
VSATPLTKKFKSYPIGYFHIDVAEVRTEQGKLHMFVAIDRTSKFAFVELHEKATIAISREFLLRLIAAVPYKIHTVLTDNGIQFTTPGAGGSAFPLIKEAIANGEIFRAVLRVGSRRPARCRHLFPDRHRQLNDVDPQAWLADVLARIAGHPAHSLDELLPWNWRQRPAAIAT